jgi:hypothetical protein
MSPESARRKIVLLSLMTTVAFSCCLIVSPLFIQLKVAQAWQVVQIVFPVFAGYLGTAVIFLFQKKSGQLRIVDEDLLKYLIYAPFGVFWIIGLTVFFFFYVSNLPGRREGMQFDDLSNYVTMLVSFMNVTTGALTAFLFQSEEAPSHTPKPLNELSQPSAGT